MSTTTNEQLHQQIEQLIRAHLAAQRTAATAAVERAFASATASARARVPRADNTTWGRRRPPKEIAGIAERQYDAVRAHPGETMAVIAPQVGETPRALNRPMLHLKNAGRVRSAGQRHLTRYFPMSSKSA
ncbi:MAG: hypothetical protein A2138_15290 [Deltaproteobacteria bacterium RBG_16_71_12]|nr:MAG: hypothetical protein A2138_15290 [Deltaproteobacteria bacterium RBG_16_71_12]